MIKFAICCFTFVILYGLSCNDNIAILLGITGVILSTLVKLWNYLYFKEVK